MTVAWVLVWLLALLAALLLVAVLLLLFLPLDLRLRLDSDWGAAGWEAEPEGSARWTARFRWGWGLLAVEWCGENLEPRPPDVRLMGFRLRSLSRPRPAGPHSAGPHSGGPRGGGPHAGGPHSDGPHAGRPHAGGPPSDGPRAGRPHAGGPPRRPEAGPRRRRRRLPRLDPELLRALLTEGMGFLRRLWEDTGLRARGQLTYGFSDPSITGLCEAARWGARIRIPFPLEPVFDRPCLVGWSEVTGRIYGFEVAREALRALRNEVIRRRIAESIRFRPLRILIFRGG